MNRKACSLAALALALALAITPADAARKSTGEFGDLFDSNVNFSVPSSKEWRDILNARTVKLWIDAQFLERLVLNARARIDITWLPRTLLKRLDRDRQVDEWVSQGLNAYLSNNSKVKSKLKGRDVVVLNFKAQKNWSFDPTEVRFEFPNGEIYQVTRDDLYQTPDLKLLAELPSGVSGAVYVLIPSFKPGTSVKISLGPDSVDFNVPKK